MIIGHDYGGFWDNAGVVAGSFLIGALCVILFTAMAESWEARRARKKAERALPYDMNGAPLWTDVEYDPQALEDFQERQAERRRGQDRRGQ